MYAAPPSRDGTPGTYSERPGVIRLTPEEAELCRLSGVDYVTYAKGKQRLDREKKMGFRQAW
jgi:hypothetical protein